MSYRMDDTWREVLAEFLGTCVLILFGAGVVAQSVLSRNAASSYLSINISWGLGVTMGCYVAGGVSGAHLNPAVTLALAVSRGFPWRKVFPYTVAQVAGAFVAAAIVYFTYHEAFAAFDGGVRQVVGDQGTGGIFSTYPRPFLSTFPGGFVDQVVGTAILMAGILAISDARNVPPPAGLAPLLVGLLVLGIGASFGFNSGYAINPARDFGPRLLTLLTGYETAMYDQNGTLYFWLPIVAPIIGGLVGGALFKFLIEAFLPAEPETITVSEPIENG